MKKYLSYFTIALISLLLTQCDSLDMESESSITDINYWTSEAHFKAFNTGLHAQFRKSSYNYFLLGEPRADLYCANPSFGGESSEGVEQLPYNTLNKESPGISNFANLYETINQLNLMIDKASVTNLLQESDRNYYLGVAYGMRAYLYFHLLRSWGDVVLHLKGTEGANLDIFNLSKAASPAKEVMEQIKADINASQEAFGNDYSFKSGRHYWSLAATLMLKGEVYLWSGKQMGGGTSDYQIAKAALQEVKNADVTLLPEFESVFTFSNKKNKEIIFTIHNQKDEYSLWNGSYASVMLPQNTYINQYYMEDGTSFSTLTAEERIQGIIRFQINYDIYQKVFRDEDKRKRATLKAVYRKDDSGNPVYVAPFANKFKGDFVEGNASRSMLDDYPIYRYADCLLLLATAKAFLGETVDEEINRVRERAYGSEYFNANRDMVAYPNDKDAGFYNQNNYVSGDENPEEAILKERLRELMFEGKRWYDLRLIGDPYIFKYSKAQATRLLWPINEDALTNNRGLVQTPGY